MSAPWVKLPAKLGISLADIAKACSILYEPATRGHFVYRAGATRGTEEPRIQQLIGSIRGTSMECYVPTTARKLDSREDVWLADSGSRFCPITGEHNERNSLFWICSPVKARLICKGGACGQCSDIRNGGRVVHEVSLVDS